MILNRLGNKRAIADKVQKYFPKHDFYMEPFMGAGGMFFYKRKARYNVVNDFDEDVYNLFRVIQDKTDEFRRELVDTLITEKQFKEWVMGAKEATDVRNAVRFIILSNFSLYGRGDTLKFASSHSKYSILERLDATVAFLKDVVFTNCDFRQFFKKLSFLDEEQSFCYCDPPYLGTGNNYSSGFTEKDSFDLFEILQSYSFKWAMSEFDHPFILEQAKKRDLWVTEIGERQNIKNVQMEILVTKYKPMKEFQFL